MRAIAKPWIVKYLLVLLTLAPIIVDGRWLPKHRYIAAFLLACIVAFAAFDATKFLLLKEKEKRLR